MERIKIITIAAVIFLTVGFLFYRIKKGYVKETYGKKWLNLWGNKVYFWQSLLFVSMADTALCRHIAIKNALTIV